MRRSRRRPRPTLTIRPDPEQLDRARRVVAIAGLRRRLGLTQHEFARRYRLPVGTVRDWEQGPLDPGRLGTGVAAGDRRRASGKLLARVLRT